MNRQAEKGFGCYRVLACEQKISKHGTPYTRFMLGNATETLLAFAWENSYTGPSYLERGTTIHCLFRKRLLGDRPVADLIHADPVMPTPANGLHLIPRHILPQPETLNRLMALISQLEQPLLTEFIQRALLDFSFVERFVSCPASIRYHHAWPGGLLVHSLECAEIIERLGIEDPLLRDLGVVAGLFHDAGKTLTLQQNRHTTLGHLANHDTLTLSVLQQPLKWLEHVWPDAAHALIHIWSCQGTTRWGIRPKTPLVYLVRMADRWSAEYDKYRAAFAEQEDWCNWARFQEERFWRPLAVPFLSCSGAINHG